MIIGELFPTEAVTKAASIAVMMNWLGSFIITVIFPTLKSSIDQYLFLPFSVICATLFVILYRWMPETKGRSLEEVVYGFSQ